MTLPEPERSPRVPNEASDPLALVEDADAGMRRPSPQTLKTKHNPYYKVLGILRDRKGGVQKRWDFLSVPGRCEGRPVAR